MSLRHGVRATVADTSWALGFGKLTATMARTPGTSMSVYSHVACSKALLDSSKPDAHVIAVMHTLPEYMLYYWYAAFLLYNISVSARIHVT